MKSLWKNGEPTNMEKVYGIVYTLYSLTRNAENKEFRAVMRHNLEMLIQKYELVEPQIRAPVIEAIKSYEGRISWFCGGGLIHKIRCGKFDRNVGIRVGEILIDAFSRVKKEDIENCNKLKNLIFTWLEELSETSHEQS